MNFALAQTTQPTVSLAMLYRAAGCAVMGAAGLVVKDYLNYLKNPAGGFSWKLCGQHAAIGAIGGILAGLGFNIAAQ